MQDCPFFPSENDLCIALLPDYLGTYSSNLCQILALKEAIGYYVYDIIIFLKWGILNVPFCSIFVPFHFYLFMTLVVPSLDNIFMVLLISEVVKIGVMKLIFWILFHLEGGFVCVGKVCYKCIVYILQSSKNLFILPLTGICA